MKTLLAIINDPKESKEFLQYVAGMAINLAGKVKVLNVHTPPNYAYGVTESAGIASAQVQGNLKELIDESNKILKKNIKEISNEVSNPVFTGFSSENWYNSYCCR